MLCKYLVVFPGKYATSCSSSVIMFLLFINFCVLKNSIMVFAHWNCESKISHAFGKRTANIQKFYISLYLRQIRPILGTFHEVPSATHSGLCHIGIFPFANVPRQAANTTQQAANTTRQAVITTRGAVNTLRQTICYLWRYVVT